MPKEIDARLDVTGVCCPLPLIQLAKSVRKLQTGQMLQITGNDPIFESSVRDFCQANGHTVLDARTGDDRRVSILIRVGS